MTERENIPAANTHVLDELYQVIQSRQGADAETSYTAKLLAAGPDKVSKKVGEEAVETVIEGVRGDNDALAGESADLLYHLLVLWTARGLEPERVWQALEARLGTSGVAEKMARKKQA